MLPMGKLLSRPLVVVLLFGVSRCFTIFDGGTQAEMIGKALVMVKSRAALTLTKEFAFDFSAHLRALEKRKNRSPRPRSNPKKASMV